MTKRWSKDSPDSIQEKSSQNPLKSVGTKLLMIIFSSIVLCVLVVGVFSYNTSKNVIKNKVSGVTHQTIVQTQEKLDLLFKGYENLSMQILLDPGIAEELGILVGNQEMPEYKRLEYYRTLTEKIDTYIYSNGDVAAIHMYLPSLQKGISGTGKLDSTIEEKSWYQKTVEKEGAVLWLDTQLEGYVETLNASTDNAKFALMRLIKDSITGDDIGVLIMELKVNALNRELSKINLGDGTNVMLINDEGKLMQSEQLELIGKEAPIDMKKVETSKEGIGTLSIDEGEQLVVYNPSDVTGWTLMGTVPVDQLTKDAKVIFTMTLWMTLFAALLALLTAYFVIRMIARPVVRLRNLMKQAEQGDLLVRMQFNSSDEIGQLAQSFNQMMEQITVLVKQTNVSAREVLERAGVLSNASKKTATSAQEIFAATEGIANGATTLTTEAERGNDLTQSIRAQMMQVIDANFKMEKSAAEVQEASDLGTDYMSQLIKKTSLTEQMTRSMMMKVDRLKESTHSIRKILDVLNNMTKQTNILSLNASIEAARAGAAGKGFVVIANEIRKLAEQSRQSIDIVSQITETIQKEIDETVEVLSDSTPIFQEQITSVKETDSIFNRVNSHMKGFVEQLAQVTGSVKELEQSQVILAETMSSVSAVSQESSATSEQVASLTSEQMDVSIGLVSLAENLEGLSNALQSSLSQFRIEDKS
jgi:methyl-accepting chemotaxis protein